MRRKNEAVCQIAFSSGEIAFPSGEIASPSGEGGHALAVDEEIIFL